MVKVCTFDVYSLETFGENKYRISTVRKPEIKGVPVDAMSEFHFADMYHVLYFLSLFSFLRVQILGARFERDLAMVEFSTERSLVDSELHEFSAAFDKMLRMQEVPLEAYLNACHAFYSALSLEEFDPSISFVLIAVAVETLSNKYYPESQYRPGFRRFVINLLPKGKSFLPSEVSGIGKALTDEDVDRLVVRLLDAVYDRVRSRFLHNGKLVPLASFVAHRLGLAFLGDTSNPGYGWFKRVAREVLIASLDRFGDGGLTDLHSLLAKKYEFRLRSRRGVVKGQLLAKEDVILQEWK